MDQTQQQQLTVSPTETETESKSISIAEVKQSPIKLRLVPAQSSDVTNGQVIANLVVVSEGDEANGGTPDDVLPYIDEAVTSVNVKQLQSGRRESTKEQKPRVRFYAVGPSTYRVKCPLCHQQANACVMRGAGCKDATCCLSLLSW